MFFTYVSSVFTFILLVGIVCCCLFITIIKNNDAPKLAKNIQYGICIGLILYFIFSIIRGYTVDTYMKYGIVNVKQIVIHNNNIFLFLDNGETIIRNTIEWQDKKQVYKRIINGFFNTKEIEYFANEQK